MKFEHFEQLFYGLVILFMLLNAFAAFVYNWNHPDMTTMQVMQLVSEWSIPLRWF